MPNGTVKFFNAGKGFGFITADEGGKDVFVPSASVTASGLATLKPGQRVSFEEVPDAKGPKAANLQLLAEPPRPVAVREKPKPRSEALTFYHDPDSEWSEHVLEEVRALGHEPLLVDYLKAPPSRDRLKLLSRQLQASGQSLVRKYDSLFFELQLDDRFIGENEFWDAIVEHPALINGPLLASEAKAGLIHTDEAIPAFFASAPAADTPVAKPKGLSARALQILAGGEVPPAAPKPAAKPAPVAATPAPAAAAPVIEMAKPAAMAEKKAPVKKEAPKAAVKPKPAVKEKAPAKKAAAKAKLAKPVKKPARKR